MTIRLNYVVRKNQLRSMSAMVYHMSDGAEVLKSYDTIVALELPDGTLVFSRYWTSKDGTATTKRHITTWCGRDIKTVRAGVIKHLFKTFADVDSDYLKVIEDATGGAVSNR